MLLGSRLDDPKRRPAGRSSGGSSRAIEGPVRRGRSTARLAEVHLEIAQVDLGVSFALVARLVVDLGPALRSPRPGRRTPGRPARSRAGSRCSYWCTAGRSAGLRRSCRRRIRIGHRPLDDPLQGMLDLAELTALDLDELRADLVIRRIDRGVHIIADPVRTRRIRGTVEVAVEGLAEGVAASDQPRVSRSKASLRAI